MPCWVIDEYQGNTQAVIDYSDISRRWVMPDRYYTKVIEGEEDEKSEEKFSNC